MGVVGGANGGRRTLRVGVRVPDVASLGGRAPAAVSWPIFTLTMGGAAATPPVAEAGVTGTAAVNLREPPAPKGIILDAPLCDFLSRQNE